MASSDHYLPRRVAGKPAEREGEHRVSDFRDNRELGRFERVEGGQVILADYRRDGARLFIDHVETPPALRGAGAAARLMAEVAAFARREGLAIVPICSYAAAWMRRHPEAAAPDA